jgi:hypothetical protein
MIDTALLRDKLARAAAGDPGAELVPPLSEEEVATFEKEHGVTLPEDYRRFLTEVASGYVNDCVMFTPFEYVKKEMRGPLSTPFPYSSSYAARIRECLRASPKALLSDVMETHGLLEEQVDGMPPGCLVLGDYGCGWQTVIVVSGEERGWVWRVGDFDGPEHSEDGSPVDFSTWLESWLTENGIA